MCEQEFIYSDNPVLNKKVFRKVFKEVMHLFLQMEPEEALYEGLNQMKDFYGADRVFVGYFDEKNNLLSFLYESCSEGVDALTGCLSRDFKETVFVKGGKYDNWLRNLKSGIDTVFSNTSEVPEVWKPLASDMIGNKVKSVVTIPMYGDKRITGFLGIEFLENYHDWSQTDLENAHFFADLFSIAVEKEAIKKVGERSLRAVLKGNTLFQRIFKELPVGIEVYDEKGYLIDINPFELDLLGTTKAEVLGVNLFKNPQIPVESMEKIKKGEETEVKSDYIYNDIIQKKYFKTNYIDKVRRLNGKCLPLRDDNQGDIFGYLVLVHHDDSYYLQKAELHASLAKLKLAVNSATSFLWEYDIASDKVIVDYDFLGVNKEHWKKLLFDPKKNRKEHIDHVHEEDVTQMRSGIESLIKGESSFFTLKYRQCMGDGNLYWFSSNYTVYKYDENGKPASLICLTTNITEQHQQEMELFKAKEAIEVKNAFIENISHEIRTPLNIIVGFSNLLAEHNESEETQYIVDLIHDNNQQLLDLIDNILSLSKIAQGRMAYKLELTDVRQLCKEVFDQKFIGKKESNEFIFDDTNPSCLVKVDKERLGQVIYLLLDNANKYTDNGKITLSYYQDGPETVRIEVKDTGRGLTKKEMENISLQFYKANSFNKGLGLGLPFSREIIEDMGGTCEVESIKGEGANFWFSLPLAEQ